MLLKAAPHDQHLLLLCPQSPATNYIDS